MKRLWFFTGCLLFSLAACGQAAPIPTATAVPTATPLPTATSVPTATAEPTIEPFLLHLTFRETSNEKKCIYEGPTELIAGPGKLVFTNDSPGTAAVNFLKHDEGYSIQDAIDYYGEEPSYLHHPYWSVGMGTWATPYDDKSVKIWLEEWTESAKVAPGESGTVWEGDLTRGIYHLVCANLDPFEIWFGTGLTVK